MDKVIGSINILKNSNAWPFKDPFIFKDYVCVLNCSALCMRTKIKLQETYPYEAIDGNNSAETLNSNFKETIFTPIPVSTLDMVIAELLQRKVDLTCEECEGSGESTCSECGATVECKECKGTGKLKDKAKVIKIDNVLFNAYLLRLMLNVCNLNDIKYLNLINKDKYIFTFSAGRYEFVISKYFGDKYDAEIIV